MDEPVKVITNEERVAMAQAQKRKITLQNLVLSAASILLFFSFWQFVAVNEIFASVRLSSVTQVFSLFITKLTDPSPDGAVLLVHIWSSLQVALIGFFLAIIIGVPLGWLMG